MSSEEPDNEVKVNLALVTQRIQQTLNDIRKVLSVDLMAFPMREGKKRFLEGASFSTSMSKDDLSRFKTEMAALNDEVVAAVITSLSADDVWLEVSGELPESDMRSLEWNPVVFQHLQTVASAVQDVLVSSNFPSELTNVEYRTPTWFIDGLYLPGLIESYWKGMAELRAARQQADELSRVEAVHQLADRWDDA